MTKPSYAQRIADLPPEKRELLELLLKEEGVSLSKSVILPRKRNTGSAPLSFAQERLWFLHQLEPLSAAYNTPTAVRIEGALDLPALERSLNEVVRRHDSLRTRFEKTREGPVQLVDPDLMVPLSTMDISSMPEAEREAEVRRLCRAEAGAPFDLAAGPLLRARVIRLREREHLVLLTMHHIVSDGWSMQVLVREIGTLYAAFAAGVRSPLQKLPIQYSDFAAWQREWLHGDVLESQLAYWKERLSAPPFVELATDRPRPRTRTSRGASIKFSLPAELLNKLRSLGQAEDATLFMTLLAGFFALLERYTGQDDICVGTPIANRQRAELENLIGFFVNTLVLRVDLSGDPSGRQLLTRVREAAVGAYAHQDVPFEMLVGELQPVRVLNRSPLFQVMFVHQNAPAPMLQAPGLRITSVEVEREAAQFDLTFSVAEGPTGLDGVIEYDADLFDAQTVARMAQHFGVLLAGMASDPERRISALPLLPKQEREQLVVELSQTDSRYPDDRCVHDLFEETAQRQPDAVAVVHQSQRVAYRELNDLANRLAHHLREMELGPEALVGICLPRSVEAIAALLAVLKAGSAYVPLDPEYPRERLGFMLADSGAVALVTQQELLDRLPPFAGRLVLLDEDQAVIEQRPLHDPGVRVHPDQLAYVIYTSGSTGQPKGTLLQHRGLTCLVETLQEAFALDEASRMLQFASLCFDASVAEIFPALVRGSAVCVPSKDLVSSLPDLHRFLQTSGITAATLPPSVLGALQTGGLGALRTVISAGEMCPDGLVQRWAVGRRFLNGYGPTESTVATTIYECSGEEDGAPPIGRPVANRRVFVLDRHQRLVPVGVPGELCVAGVGLARGYLRRPDLTAEKFVPDPFTAEAGSRLYRTGDLVRYRPDGNLEFLGRIDHQVKVRGFRIELGEIEARLREHAAVEQVVVDAKEDSRGQTYLAAYLVPDQKVVPTVNELRAFLKRHLPDYMIPAAFVTLHSLPVTPNGKVDRRALPDPGRERPDLEERYMAPRNPHEKIVAELWAKLLGIDRVGVHDNFFEVGGHSILATQLVTRVREAFGVDLPVRSVFENPTVAGLASCIEGATRVEDSPLRPVPREKDLPLSFAQERLWFLDQLSPGDASYNIPLAVRLTGELDEAALKRSLNAVVQRHESLRTVFVASNGKPRQVVLNELAISLPVTDLQHLPDDAREEVVQQISVEEARRPFDLKHGPLLRARLLRLAIDDHVALLNMHHIVSDGWSMNTLMHELAAFYDTKAVSARPRLPALTIQYADFAHWQRNWLQGDRREKLLDYWKRQLDASPPLLKLPTDRPRPAEQTSVGAHLSFEVPRDLAQSIRALGRNEGASLFMTLLAAFQTLLYRCTGEDDVNVGTPIANRNRAETEGLIGFFVNTLVLRGDLSGSPSFRSLLQRVRDVALNAYAHQDLPFEMVVDALQPERNLSHTPLFQVMFVLQNAPFEVMELPGLTLSSLPIESGASAFDLTLVMEETAETLVGGFEYNTDLFDTVTIERLAVQYQKLLRGIVADPDRPISRLPMLSDAEERRLVNEWNATVGDYSFDHCIHHIIEAQVERTPGAIAVVCGDQRLNYRELNNRANQLATYLRSLGLGRGNVVGICAERSLEMVIGLLGVLKAGAAYVPLDPAHPPERLSFVIADAGVRVLITQARLLDDLPSTDVEVVTLDSQWIELAVTGADNPNSGATSADPAYVIYTSGSTGQPKGVVVSHRNVVNHNKAVERLFRLETKDRVLQFAAISFDVAVEEIYPTLMSGATLVLRPTHTLTGAELVDLIESEQLTVLNLPTAYWHEWVYELSLVPRPLPESLRLVVVGGEKASPERLALWRKMVRSEIDWMNAYGPTEATVTATAYRLGPGQPLGSEVPIGRPIGNTRLYILDAQSRLVPVGVSGELCIGGAGVALGYLNDPQRTAASFIPDPFSDEQGVRLYKTGDLVRYRRDGNVEFVGRVDQQVKIRGFRIEPGEIEAALAQHPDVRDAVIEPWAAGSDTDRRLVAYVVLAPGSSATLDELRDFLATRLPDYMVPAAFVTLDALPLTPTKKVDRRALPAPDQNRLDTGQAFVAPRTSEEEVLVDIWSEVLGVKRISVEDSFFDLGGDSILGIQVIARANQAGLHLTPRQLFEQPTVAGLAAVAGQAKPVNAEQGVVTGELPLSPIQRWFFEQDFADPQHWNQSLLLEVDQHVEPGLLGEAVRHLLLHHDALRLRFERTATGWRQYCAEMSDDPPVAWIDLSDRSEDEWRSTIEAEATRFQASLDFLHGPLLRFVHFDLGSERPGRLLMVVHHLAIDGVSWRIVLEDLQFLVEQLRDGRAVQLPPKTTSFRDWACRLDEFADSEAPKEELDYWLSVPGERTLQLPVDREGGENTEASARDVAVSLSHEETRALLKEVPPVYGTEINDVLLTALAMGLRDCIGSRPLLVDLEGHGREELFDDVDISRTVGWFTTVYPVRLDLVGVENPGEALKSIKEHLRRLPRRGLGYGLLRYMCRDQAVVSQLRELGQPFLTFNYLGQFDQVLPTSARFRPAAEPIGPAHGLQNKRTHLLDVTAGIMGGSLQYAWSYSENVHRRPTIQRLADAVVDSLRLIIAHCQSSEAGGYTPSDFSLAEIDQRRLDKIISRKTRRTPERKHR